MIIKGKSRSGPAALAAHLSNAEKNERITLVETIGTVAQDLRGALIEMDSHAYGTKCTKPLYHAAISPEPPHRLTPQQRLEAVVTLEMAMDLTGHARVVVVHEKEGREHIHVVWSRIDLDDMRAVSDSHNYRRHEEVARFLEKEFSHDRVQGAHHERDGVERPMRTPSRAELRQEERTGILSKQVREEVTALFRSADNAEAFKSALEDKGYILAQGDRRDFVIVDKEGGVHSLARRIEGVKAAELREFMKTLRQDTLPTVEAVKDAQIDREIDRGIELDAAPNKNLEEAIQRYDIDKRNAEGPSRESEHGSAPEETQTSNLDPTVDRDSTIEKAYGRGDDYVSQSMAALKDNERRNKGLNDDPRPTQPDTDHEGAEDELAAKDKESEEQRVRQEADTTARQQSSDQPPPQTSPAAEKYELSDRAQRMLGRAGREREEYNNKRYEDHEPDRQNEVSGDDRARDR